MGSVQAPPTGPAPSQPVLAPRASLVEYPPPHPVIYTNEEEEEEEGGDIYGSRRDNDLPSLSSESSSNSHDDGGDVSAAQKENGVDSSPCTVVSMESGCGQVEGETPSPMAMSIEGLAEDVQSMSVSLSQNISVSRNSTESLDDVKDGSEEGITPSSSQLSASTSLTENSSQQPSEQTTANEDPSYIDPKLDTRTRAPEFTSEDFAATSSAVQLVGDDPVTSDDNRVAGDEKPDSSYCSTSPADSSTVVVAMTTQQPDDCLEPRPVSSMSEPPPLRSSPVAPGPPYSFSSSLDQLLATSTTAQLSNSCIGESSLSVHVCVCVCVCVYTVTVVVLTHQKEVFARN